MSTSTGVTQRVASLQPFLSAGSIDHIHLRDAIDTLSALAIDLRDDGNREVAGSAQLAPLLVTLIESASSSKSGGTSPLANDTDALIGQCARVAANLVADNDENRDRLVQAGYPRAILKRLSGLLRADVDGTRFVLASLYNLVIDGHEPTLQLLAEAEQLTRLLNALSEISKLHSDDGWLSIVLPFMLTIIAKVYQVDAAPLDTLTASHLAILLHPLASNAGFQPSLLYVQTVTSLCETVTMREGYDCAAFLMPLPGGRTIFDHLMEFVDTSLFRIAEDGEASNDGLEKEMADAKGALAQSITAISSFLNLTEPHHKTLFHQLLVWLAMEDREDLLSTALLSLGNMACDDATAIALLRDERIVQAILRCGDPSRSILVQHAVLGLLRNLSVPMPNKVVILERKILAQVLSMDWQKLDLAKPAQASGVAALKNLCRNVECAVYILDDPAIGEILRLAGRTDDFTLKFEITRLFVNAARTLANDTSRPRPAAWAVVAGEDVLRSYAAMLHRGERYPVLVNEALIAMALCAVYGGADTPKHVLESLRQESLGDEKTALDHLVQLVGGDAHPAKEVQSNAATLLGLLVSVAGEDAPELKRVLQRDTGSDNGSAKGSDNGSDNGSGTTITPVAK